MSKPEEHSGEILTEGESRIYKGTQWDVLITNRGAQKSTSMSIYSEKKLPENISKLWQVFASECASGKIGLEQTVDDRHKVGQFGRRAVGANYSVKIVANCSNMEFKDDILAELARKGIIPSEVNEDLPY